MSEFDRPIGRVWRRLRFQRFLAALVWCLAAGLILVAAEVVAAKFFPRLATIPNWAPWAAAGGLAVLAALVIAVFTGPSRLDAAVAIDHSFGLAERLSTAIALPDDLRETPAGSALLTDARRHLEHLDVASQFSIRAPRRAWVPLIPAALAFGLMFLPAELVQAKEKKAARPVTAEEKKAISQSMKSLAKTLNAQRKELEKQQLTETEQILAQIEKAAEKLEKSPPATKDRAMVEMNKLTDMLKDRQKQVGTSEQIAKQLQQLKEMSSEGPADDLAKDLAKGDFAKAAADLKKLKEQMKNGKLSDAQKKELAEQVKELKEKLDQLANMDERRKQLEDAKKSGAISEEQYKQQMAKLDEQAKQLKNLQKLAKTMQEVQQALEQGDTQKAANALGMSEQQLQEMARDLAEMETLDQALAELQEAKNGMAGDGMNQLGQRLDGFNQLGQNDGQGNNGQGLGRGRGQGDRPEAPDNTSAYNTKVKQQFGKGKAVLEGFGPYSKQVKGASVLEIQETVEAASEQAAEALTNQKIPSSIRRHVQGYFDQIRKGQ
jgi:chemotaxis protein histidine kinase CheA